MSMSCTLQRSAKGRSWSLSYSQAELSSVVTGRVRLLGFRVGFVGQNPSLGILRLSGCGPFRALGFSGLFQAFLMSINKSALLISSYVFYKLFYLIKSSPIPTFTKIKPLSMVYNLTMVIKPLIRQSMIFV